jgi:hypothetical protein
MRIVNGDWGRYACRIITKTTWRGAPRWRYVIDREFAGITKTECSGRWRKTEAEAERDGERRLDGFEKFGHGARAGRYL